MFYRKNLPTLGVTDYGPPLCNSLTTGWWIFLTQISLPDHVSEWPILAHSCLLLCLCKGLPKAVMINHQRLWYGTGFVTASGVKGDDVIYTTLPLYHSAAMMVGIHGCILIGKLFLSKRHWSPVYIHVLQGKVIQNLATSYLPGTAFNSMLVTRILAHTSPASI